MLHILLSLVALLWITLLISHASKRHMRKALSNIPGGFVIPVIGPIHRYYNLRPTNILKKDLEIRKEFGKVATLMAMNRYIVTSIDGELNEQLLSSQVHIAKQANYDLLKPWLGTGLLLSDAKKWFSRRKILTPAFHFKILEDFMEVFNQQSNILVDCLAKEADGKSVFDVYPYICRSALDIIAESSMGVKIHAQTEKSPKYATDVYEITKLIVWRSVRLYLLNETLFSILHPFMKLRANKLIKSMHEFTTKVIEERREKLQATLSNCSKKESSEDAEVGLKKRMALLDILLQSSIDGKPLSNEDIREEVDTFMFEGHDTTTAGICFALHLISRHPEVQEKILVEINSVLGSDRNRLITLADLSEMKYMECVIKEALRLYPPVPIIARLIKEDFHYTHSKLGKGVIPAGTEFFVVIYTTNRDPDNYANPNEFIPERHENIETSTGFTMLPFSAGPRNCIGQKFAMLEMKTVIAKLVQTYKLLPLGQNVAPEFALILRSTTGFQLGLQRR